MTHTVIIYLLKFFSPRVSIIFGWDTFFFTNLHYSYIFRFCCSYTFSRTIEKLKKKFFTCKNIYLAHRFDCPWMIKNVEEYFIILIILAFNLDRVLMHRHRIFVWRYQKLKLRIKNEFMDVYKMHGYYLSLNQEEKKWIVHKMV